MIGLELKADTKTPSKLVLSSQDAQQNKLPSALSFASLLSGITDQEKDLKLPQNGTLVLSLKDNPVEEKTKDTKHSSESSSILALLKEEEAQTPKNESKPLELNPKLTQEQTVSELKVIIQEAKQYLKNKITSLEGFKKSEIASLPKTLKGLVQVAQKFGIDVSKVTLEEVKSSVSKKLPQEGKGDIKVAQTLETKPVKDVKKTVQNDNRNDVELEEIPQTKQQLKPEKKTLTQTPLFKAQEKPAEITTQQLVSVKVGAEIDKTQKEKTKNTLELLLRGEKVLKQETSMTADFSVATARVIAPQAKTNAQENLESLLSGENTEHPSTNPKTDSLQVHKADSFEVKLNEAKQMIKYLSQDVKQAIEDYKAPFTRVKVQLNPQNLGEVDLTVVQRGKNLHINLSSNNVAINTLAMNVNDLKVQLNNSGIQNASLNFSNMSQGEHGGAGSHTHQQQHNRQNAQEEYGYFQNEEANEEIVNSLEIVVPHYA